MQLDRLLVLGFLPGLAVAQGVAPRDAWQQFQAEHGQAWTAEWNAATGTPRAIYGQGLKVAPALGSLAEARVQATALLERYRDLLGRGGSRFVEADAAGVRHLFYFRYRQRFAGLDVVGGRADVRINRRGVVAMFGATTVPVPQDFQTVPQLAAGAAQAIAEGKVLGQARNGAGVPAPRLVIWARDRDGVLAGPKLAWEVQLDARPARVLVAKVFVEARTGTVLEVVDEVFTCGGCNRQRVSSVRAGSHLQRAMAKRRSLRRAVPRRDGQALTGRVMAWTNLGARPTDALTNVPVANVQVTSSAGNAFTGLNGNFTIPYTGTAPVTCTATLRGRHMRRVRVARGTALTAAAPISPTGGGTIQFGSATMGEQDWSQTTTYHFVDDVNRYLRRLLPTQASELDNLSVRLDPVVNINQACNAFYTNYSINFYSRNGACNMTAFGSIIQHEWGHALDHEFGGIKITEGLAEGWADVLAILRGNTPLVGDAFFRSGNALRTALNTRTFPVRSTSVHDQGEVWMGWVWDLKGELEARLGAAAGYDLVQRLVIPTIVADASTLRDQVREVFLLDDDDGNLNNGTPHHAALERASLRRRIHYPRRVDPQAGAFVTIGSGCAGSAATVLPCPAANTRSRSLFADQDDKAVALSIPPRNARTVVQGFSIFSQATRGSVFLETSLYLADPSGRPAARPVATSLIGIGSRAAWYRTLFTPVVIPPNQGYFLSFLPAKNMRAPYFATGDKVRHFWRPVESSTWRGPLRHYAWAYRVECGAMSGGAVPEMRHLAAPLLGAPFALQLSAARPNATGLLFLGASDRAWRGLTLPFDLTGLGAPGCRLIASGDLQFAMTTDARGGATWSVRVPGDPGLLGSAFYSQFLITDPANPFGVVVSNGAAGRIGRE